MNLPDVNVLVAMSCRAHAHYSAAVQWHGRAVQNNETWALCRLTSLGLLRLLTNPAVLGTDVLTPAKAWTVLEKLESDPFCSFLDEPPDCMFNFKKITTAAEFRPRDLTDAYLAAFAVSSHSRIITFDRRFNHWPQVRSLILAP